MTMIATATTVTSNNIYYYFVAAISPFSWWVYK